MVIPGLALQVAEAVRDYVITPAEFNEIMGTISSILVGAFVFGAVGMLIGKIHQKGAPGSERIDDKRTSYER